jgi:hypothetical protein
MSVEKKPAWRRLGQRIEGLFLVIVWHFAIRTEDRIRLNGLRASLAPAPRLSQITY